MEGCSRYGYAIEGRGVTADTVAAYERGEDGIHFEKYRGNPCWNRAEGTFEANQFRDPKVWKRGRLTTWYAALRWKGQVPALLFNQRYIPLIFFNVLAGELRGVGAECPNHPWGQHNTARQWVQGTTSVYLWQILIMGTGTPKQSLYISGEIDWD